MTSLHIDTYNNYIYALCKCMAITIHNIYNSFIII